MRSTKAYRFTIPFDINDGLVPDRLWRLRHLVKLHNKLAPSEDHLRVVLRGRLGPNNPWASLYRRGGRYYRPSSMSIRTEHATRMDVYVHHRPTWELNS